MWKDLSGIDPIRCCKKGSNMWKDLSGIDPIRCWKKGSNMWKDLSGINPIDWICGYCGNQVGGDRGYHKSLAGNRDEAKGNDRIYICPRCDNPTAFILEGGTYYQIPGPSYGNSVEGLPETVEAMYNEIRECMKAGVYTSAVLSDRKLLMHIAVEQGAEEGKKFFEYIEYLSDAGYVPPNGKDWVDEIRKRGNEATHDIVMATKEDAQQLLDFTEMLLKFIYEFPSKVRRK